MTCARARALIQEAHDAGGPGSSDLQSHIAGCPGCSAFQSFVRGLGAEIRGELQSALAPAAPPDWNAILACAASMQRQRRAIPPLRIAIEAAAAVLVIGVGLGAGLLAWRTNEAHAHVSSSVDSFVESLFADPLLAGAEFSGASDGLPDPTGLSDGSSEESWVDQLFSETQ